MKHLRGKALIKYNTTEDVCFKYDNNNITCNPIGILNA